MIKKLFVIFSIFFLGVFVFFILQGCNSRVITDYDKCIFEKLYFEFKDDLNIYLIDDSKGKNRYSNMNFKKGEDYICIGKKDTCIKDFKGAYYKGWKILPLASKRFYLTGKYKISKPFSLFMSETSALQIDINHTKAWISIYEINDKTNFKKSSLTSIQKLNKLRGEHPKWMTIFKCPNPNVKKVGWDLILFD